MAKPPVSKSHRSTRKGGGATTTDANAARARKGSAPAAKAGAVPPKKTASARKAAAAPPAGKAAAGRAKKSARKTAAPPPTAGKGKATATTAVRAKRPAKSAARKPARANKRPATAKPATAKPATAKPLEATPAKKAPEKPTTPAAKKLAKKAVKKPAGVGGPTAKPGHPPIGSAAKPHLRPDFAFEDELGALQGRTVVGVDEAGRAPLAGPVVAAAVWLHRLNFPKELAAKVNDCKQVKDNVRQELYVGIVQNARVGLGQASVEEIDRFNIFQASLLAMERAIGALGLVPDVVLVDGKHLPRRLPCPGRAIVDGDCRSLSIAAASIIAKVTRDRIMADLARVHPGYGWEHNRGYGTPEHLAALRGQGVSPQHRRSFAPVRARLATPS